MHRFEKVTDYIRQTTVGLHHVPCCDLIVMKDHSQVYRYTTGISNHRDCTSLQPNTLFYMYSCTKPLTATAGMRLVEEGKLFLDAPVSDYLPAFSRLFTAKNGEIVPVDSPLTVRHLFTMSGGFDYAITNQKDINAVIMANPDAATQDIVNIFAQRPLTFSPGTRFQYSICHDILAAVIELVVKMPFRSYLDQLIFTPLGMHNSTLHAQPLDLERMADQFAVQDGKIVPIEKTNEFIFTNYYDSGGAGLISTADDYSVFADTMACNGTSQNGYQLLKPETIRLMASPQIDMHLQDTSALSLFRPDYSYGLGVRTRVKTTPASSPVGEFGWDGAAGSYVLIDPTNHISIFFAMHVRNWPQCIGEDHLILRDLIYEAIS